MKKYGIDNNNDIDKSNTKYFEKSIYINDNKYEDNNLFNDKSNDMMKNIANNLQDSKYGGSKNNYEVKIIKLKNKINLLNKHLL